MGWESYLASHLMAWDRNEKEVCLIRIFSAEATLSNILKEVTLTCILASELPGSLVKSIGIAIWVYINLEFPLHLRVIQPKNLRRVIHIRDLIICSILNASQLNGQLRNENPKSISINQRENKRWTMRNGENGVPERERRKRTSEGKWMRDKWGRGRWERRE